MYFHALTVGIKTWSTSMVFFVANYISHFIFYDFLKWRGVIKSNVPSHKTRTFGNFKIDQKHTNNCDMTLLCVCCICNTHSRPECTKRSHRKWGENICQQNLHVKTVLLKTGDIKHSPEQCNRCLIWSDFCCKLCFKELLGDVSSEIVSVLRYGEATPGFC